MLSADHSSNSIWFLIFCFLHHPLEGGGWAGACIWKFGHRGRPGGSRGLYNSLSNSLPGAPGPLVLRETSMESSWRGFWSHAQTISDWWIEGWDEFSNLQESGKGCFPQLKPTKHLESEPPQTVRITLLTLCCSGVSLLV